MCTSTETRVQGLRRHILYTKINIFLKFLSIFTLQNFRFVVFLFLTLEFLLDRMIFAQLLFVYLLNLSLERKRTLRIFHLRRFSVAVIINDQTWHKKKERKTANKDLNNRFIQIRNIVKYYLESNLNKQKVFQLLCIFQEVL